MAEKTRTVMLWFNEDQARLTLAVNPREMTVTRSQSVREFRTVGGEPVQVSQGRGSCRVRFSTFLPGTASPFYEGTPPLTALALLHQWQDSRHAVRLVVSGTDVNGLFLLTQVGQTITAGDQDMGISLELTEAGTAATTALSGVQSGETLASRSDERVEPGTYTVQKGDTLWGIARSLYQDGTRWKEIARKNGISDPKTLQIGQVLVL